jgi:glutamate synthase (NADPH/NADH) large chain
VAEKILTNMDTYLERFIKVIPYEYKKVLIEMALEETRKKMADIQQDVEMIDGI